MKLVVTPTPEQIAGLQKPRAWFAETTDLGGVFYDYLRDSSGIIVGVRYHLMKNVKFEEHPVYRQFIDDSRFVFRANDSVDMVAEGRYAHALQEGSLALDVVQDFDGVKVLEAHGVFTLMFDLQFASPDSP